MPPAKTRALTQKMFLACRNLTLTYPHGEHPVFSDLTFELNRPGLHALFGHSGAGKTSLARMITGQLSDSETITSGEIQTRDMDILLYSYNTERLPGWSPIARHLEKITPSGYQTRKDDLIALFGLEACMDQPFNRLSLGQKNRINLIRYLVQDFDLLVMDESLANVDERTREKIILTIKALYPNRLLLYISHNLIEVSKFCDQIIVLRDVARKPQGVMVRGQNRMMDHQTERPPERAMLEIMNAA